MSTLTRIQLVLALVLCGTVLALPVWPQLHPIDAAHSVIMVHVFKSGLFSAFADNHEIRAPISGGLLDETGRRVELVIDARKLMALDPSLTPEKSREVQQRMLGPEVLDSDRFHEIRFEASKVEQTSRDHFLVSGSLSLHGRTAHPTFQRTLPRRCHLKATRFWHYSSKHGRRYGQGQKRTQDRI